MASAADRFSTLQKVGIFLIVLGQEKARDILDGVDVETLQRLNATITELGELTAEEKAAVMIEFGDFFYKGKEFLPISKRPAKKGAKTARPAAESTKAKSSKSPESKKPKKAGVLPPPGTKKVGAPGPSSATAESNPPATKPEEEKIVISALKKLRERVDPKQIDWSRAGYDFGEGFKGPTEERR
jgi:hypothetical protein